MTNADKYLKDGVDDRDFAKALSNYIADGGRKITDKEDIRAETLYFLTDEAKPTLTEDEKVILKCIDRDGLQYESLFRDGFRLYARGYDRTTACLVPFEYMFKFIKNGEEYKISDLLGDE